MNNTYTKLEPGTVDSLASLPYSTPGISTLATSITFLYVVFLLACVAGTAFVFIRGSLFRVQASEAGIRKSNEEYKRGALGLLGVLSLFLILYTVNRDLLRNDIGLNNLQTQNSAIIDTPQSPSQYSSTASYSARVSSHNTIVQRLAPSGIHTNHNDSPCTEAQFSETSPSCTSLAFLPEETVQMLLQLNRSCDCTIVITGGTEPGHQTHGEGKRMVDLKLNASQSTSDPLYKFIYGSANRGLENNNCYLTFVWNSFTFCDEKPRSNGSWGPHFHVS